MRGSAVLKIVSGGQTGVDRAALDAALERGLPCGGWCPRGRRAEDGRIDPRYPLVETPSPAYAERTERNIRDSEGTLVLAFGRPTGGTALTIARARVLGRPLLVLDLAADVDPEAVVDWLRSHAVRTLNVAGPRESQSPGVYARARELLSRTLAAAERSLA
jgi:hypothetical protein